MNGRCVVRNKTKATLARGLRSGCSGLRSFGNIQSTAFSTDQQGEGRSEFSPTMATDRVDGECAFRDKTKGTFALRLRLVMNNHAVDCTASGVSSHHGPQ